MTQENLTWEQVYDLPLVKDEFTSYAWAKNGTMAIQFLPWISKEDRIKIVCAINGSIKLNIKQLSKDGCDFLINEKPAFFVRGWGHLTGTGALNLPQEKALEIQNGFIDHVFKSLNS